MWRLRNISGTFGALKGTGGSDPITTTEEEAEVPETESISDIGLDSLAVECSEGIWMKRGAFNVVGQSLVNISPARRPA
jgi:hypothetical protein